MYLVMKRSVLIMIDMVFKIIHILTIAVLIRMNTILMHIRVMLMKQKMRSGIGLIMGLQDRIIRNNIISLRIQIISETKIIQNLI